MHDDQLTHHLPKDALAHVGEPTMGGAKIIAPPTEDEASGEPVGTLKSAVIIGSLLLLNLLMYWVWPKVFIAIILLNGLFALWGTLRYRHSARMQLEHHAPTDADTLKPTVFYPVTAPQQIL